MERGARHASVFQQLSAMQLVETYRDVETIQLDSNVGVYFGRFVVFINWLHRHRCAYDFWRHLVQDHSELLTKAICVMGSMLGKLCSGQANPLLSLNETCQRLRCLMACCGGNVNVITRGDADFTDEGVQTVDILLIKGTPTLTRN